MARPPRNKPFTLEDYDDTTVPVERVATPPDYAYYGEENLPPDALIGSAAQQYAPPAPQEAYPQHQPPQTAGYPVAPPARQKKQRNYPPGGAPYLAQPAYQYRARRSPLPGLVGLGFVLVQLVLLARAVCLLFNVQATSVWLALLFAASDLFVEPLRLLVAKLNISVLAGTQTLLILELLVAALAYGILSRILVRILKALLNH